MSPLPPTTPVITSYSIHYTKLYDVFVYGSAANDDVLDALDAILKSTVIRCIPLADTTVPDEVLQSVRSAGETLFDVSASAALLGLA